MSGAVRDPGLRNTSGQDASEGPAGAENPQDQRESAPRTETPQADTQDGGTRTPESETPEQTHARLAALLAKRRIVEEIEDMRRQLAGEAPASQTESAAGRKRAVSSTAETSEAHRSFYPEKSTPIFEGKTLKDVTIFKTRWEIQFAAIVPPPDERRRVAIAATGLRGMALESWGRRTEPIETWDEFIEWCRNLVQDPANRTLNAYIRLKHAQQRKGQSVRDFVNYIEEQEKDIPDEEDNRLRKAWTLLTGLDDDIRQGVLRENKDITSREQVIVAAQRQEELLRRREKREEKRDETPQTPSRRGTRPSQGRQPSTSSQTSGTRGKEEKSSREETTPRRCFKCQKPGHIAKDCPSGDRKDRPSSTSESPTPSKKGRPAP
jgi:hypothetical protein